jgi:aldehyde:ferredoxin oxidoreductase
LNKEGTTASIQPDLEVILKEYYQYRGWDLETGKPTRGKLIELDLHHVAEELYP